MKRLLLDTNLLVLWIVGNLDPSRIGRRRLEFFEQPHLLRLNEIVAGFSHHVSTPNILTETSNLIGAGDQQLAHGAATALGLYIESLTEIYVPSIDTLVEPFYVRLGLADASLAHLAARVDHVLTVDGPLYGLLTGHDIAVDNFWHHVAITK